MKFVRPVQWSDKIFSPQHFFSHVILPFDNETWSCLIPKMKRMKAKTHENHRELKFYMVLLHITGYLSIIENLLLVRRIINLLDKVYSAFNKPSNYTWERKQMVNLLHIHLLI